MNFIKAKGDVFVNVEAIASAKIKSRPTKFREDSNPRRTSPGEPQTIKTSVGEEIKSVEVRLVNGKEFTFEGAEAMALIGIITTES